MLKRRTKSIVIVLLSLCCIVCALIGVNALTNRQKAGAIARSDVKAVGVDISYHQGNVNFDTLCSNADFVILRLSYSTNFIDEKFDTYSQAVMDRGLPFGIYIYSLADSVAEATTEANYVINALNSRGLNNRKMLYPVFFDYEEVVANGEGDGLTPESRSKAENTQIINTFLDTVRAAGYYPGLYMGGSLMTNCVNTADVKGDIWVAAYGGTFANFSNKWYANASGKCTMWQYATNGYGESSTLGSDVHDGYYYGVNSSQIDQNFCFVDYPSKIRSSGLNGFNKYKVTVTNDNNKGTVTGSDLSNEIEGNTQIEVIITPKLGYKVKSVTVNGVAESISNPSKVVLNKTVTEAMSIVVVYENIIYSLSISSDSGKGTVTGSSVGSNYVINDNISLTVKSKSGYRIKSIKVNDLGQTIDNDRSMALSITVSGNVNVVVQYEAVMYSTLVITNVDGGTVTGITDGQSIQEATQVQLSIQAKEGYDIKSVSIGGQALTVSDKNTFTTTHTVVEDVILVVEYEKESYVATVSIPDGVMFVGIENNKAYNYGDQFILGISVYQGYELTSIKINGIAQTITDKKVFTKDIVVEGEILVEVQCAQVS